MLYFAKWKIIAIVAVCAFGILLALPNLAGSSLLSSLPSWLPHKTVHLGLDLRGGAHVVLEVDREDLLERVSKQLLGDVRASLRSSKIGYQALQRGKQQVTFQLREQDDSSRAVSDLRKLAEPVTSLIGTPGQENDIAVDASGSKVTVRMTDGGIDQRISRAVQQAMEVVRRRIDALGTTEPTIQRQGTGRILVQVPGLGNTQELIELLKNPAVMTFQLLCEAQPQGATPRAPAGCELVYSRREQGEAEDAPLFPYFLQTSSRAKVEGDELVDAQPGFDQRTNEPIVNFRFNTKGARRFGLLTRNNVGRPFAIVLNGEVVSAPVIREPILGGSGQISGGFTVQEANNLAIVLRSGALPAKLVIVEERTVGPSLGADSIAAGKIAAVIGMAAVVGFILISYGLFGIFANISLMINIVLIIGVLSLLQATLTLPGIGGIVLTIGMAVDANVLIFERIREEVHGGKTPIAAIDTGYSRALGTILDANITTLIAAFILFGLGSGPIRGFSITLGIGIITSVFTAFTVTRFIVSLWYKRFRPRELPI